MTILGQSITSEDIKHISQYLIPLSLKKGEVFIERGQRSNKIGIILNGLMVGTYISEKGKKETSKIYSLENKNNIVSDYENFMKGTESEETIKAMEDTQLMTITKKDLEKVCQLNPGIEKLIRQATEISYVNAVKRLKKFQCLSAEERVADFYSKNKVLFNRMNKQDIASYLGMHRNVFNRIMKEIVKEG